MDREWPEEKRRRFVEVAALHPALKGLHDLRTRTSGAHDFVQFHVWVDPDDERRRGAPGDGRGRAQARGANSPASRSSSTSIPKARSTSPATRWRRPISPPLRRSSPMPELAASSRSTPSPTARSPAIRPPWCRWRNGFPTRCSRRSPRRTTSPRPPSPCRRRTARPITSCAGSRPTVEVALCGHATLASGHVLIGERDRVRFRTRKVGHPRRRPRRRRLPARSAADPGQPRHGSAAARRHRPGRREHRRHHHP